MKIGEAVLTLDVESDAFANYYNDADDSEFIQVYSDIQQLYNQNI